MLFLRTLEAPRAERRVVNQLPGFFTLRGSTVVKLFLKLVNYFIGPVRRLCFVSLESLRRGLLRSPGFDLRWPIIDRYMDRTEGLKDGAHTKSTSCRAKA